MIDSTSDQKDIHWLYFISSTSLVMSITTLLFRWRKEHMFSFSGNFQTNNFNEIFQFLILLCSTLCIPLSIEYIECTKMAIAEFMSEMPLEPRASWFSPKCVEAQQLTRHLGVKHCFSAGRHARFLFRRYALQFVFEFPLYPLA
ncbi:hypothetical protein GQ457_08G017690 [Hibiscus cannabinus]